MKVLSKVLFLLIVLAVSTLNAASKQPILVDDAFHFSATVKDKGTVSVHWDIAPGYHLYKERFSYKLMAPAGASLGNVLLPAGISQEDDILGKHQVYNQKLSLDIPIEHLDAKAVTMRVCYQGCADDNFCYPPQTKEITLDLRAPPGTLANTTTVENGNFQSQSQQDKITAMLEHDSVWLIIISFFGFGLLLALTPCVLPMIPILSGIIVGHGASLHTKKAFFLSLTYVVAAALTYAIAGVIAGFLGESLQIFFQAPWVLVSFSLVFILLALSLFGLYELRLPSCLQEKFVGLSNRQKSGSYIGTAVMGVLAALIVSPCVTAPLVGALVYISTTGNALLGGVALFVMGLGMGVPLIIIGTSSGRWLPKAGVWMNTIKALFGVLLVAAAIVMLSRIIPGSLSLILWAALLIISGVYLGVLNPSIQSGWGKLWKGCGLLFVIYGAMLIVGSGSGSDDPLQPLAKFVASSRSSHIPTDIPTRMPNLVFKSIKTNDDLDRELARADVANKPVMLDFYADWCIACKEMDDRVFTDPTVRALLKNWILLRADITANDKLDKSLKERLSVIAPPTILFFDAKSNEIEAVRVVGAMKVTEFIEHMQSIDVRSR
jgi:thioredoxin:protein disulfide reductase